MTNINRNGNKARVPRSPTMNGTKADPIAAALRRLHDDVVAEEVPDEFLRILSEIDRKIEGGKPV